MGQCVCVCVAGMYRGDRCVQVHASAGGRCLGTEAVAGLGGGGKAPTLPAGKGGYGTLWG